MSRERLVRAATRLAPSITENTARARRSLRFLSEPATIRHHILLALQQHNRFNPHGLPYGQTAAYHGYDQGQYDGQREHGRGGRDSRIEDPFPYHTGEETAQTVS